MIAETSATAPAAASTRNRNPQGRRTRPLYGAANAVRVDLDTWTKRRDSLAPRLSGAVSILRRTLLAMPTRTRTPNVAAAQWSPNGGALGCKRT